MLVLLVISQFVIIAPISETCPNFRVLPTCNFSCQIWVTSVLQEYLILICAKKTTPIYQKKNRYSKFSPTSRSSQQRCSIKKGVLKNFAKFIGKHLCQSVFFNEVAGLRPATLLKKSHWHRCFPVNFATASVHYVSLLTNHISYKNASK